MSAPALFQAAQGIGSINADNLNSVQQTCDNFAQLRAFIGTQGMQVCARGQSAPNDGSGGIFYWNSTSIAADNNSTIINPTGGAFMGRWVFLTLTALPLPFTTFKTVAELEAAFISTTTSFIEVAGYYTLGDGGGGTYLRSGATVPAPGLIQSADGAGWQLQAPRFQISVKQLGAKVDGVTNDQVAAQAACDLIGLLGGGTVLLAPGTMKIVVPLRTTSPSSTHFYDGMPIVLNYPDISIIGEGQNTSFIYLRSYGDLPMDANWQVVDGLVWRGPGIFVRGSVSSSTPWPIGELSGFQIYQDGNGNTGNRSFPANVTTGDGWDITNKGLWFEQDYYSDPWNVNHVTIHDLRGELIYGGTILGPGVPLGQLSYNNLYNTNADAFSFSSSAFVQYNNINNCYTSAVENGQENAITTRIENNYITNCPYQPISIIGNSATSGDFRLNYNTFINCGSIFLRNIPKYECADNFIQDYPGISGGAFFNFSAGTGCANGVIRNNRFICDTVSMIGSLFLFNAGDTNIVVRDNIASLTPNAISNSFTFNGIINNTGTPANYASILFSDNQWNATFGGTQNASPIPLLLTTTAATIVADRRPAWCEPHQVNVNISVLNASTNVTITWKYTDIAGNVQTLSILPLTSLAVGVYSYRAMAYVGNLTYDMTVNVTAGTANNVTASASIIEKALH